jgi:hypothetical protein
MISCGRMKNEGDEEHHMDENITELGESFLRDDFKLPALLPLVFDFYRGETTSVTDRYHQV